MRGINTVMVVFEDKQKPLTARIQFGGKKTKTS